VGEVHIVTFAVHL